MAARSPFLFLCLPREAAVSSVGDGTGRQPRLSARRGQAGPAVTAGHPPAALPAGDDQREDVEGEEDAEAEEHAAHIGIRCAEPGRAIRGWPPRDLPQGPLRSQAPPTAPPRLTGYGWRHHHLQHLLPVVLIHGFICKEVGGAQPSMGATPHPVPAHNPRWQGHAHGWVLPPTPWAYLGRHFWRGGSRAEPPRTPHPLSSPPPPRRSCCWGNPSSAVPVQTGERRG